MRGVQALGLSQNIEPSFRREHGRVEIMLYRSSCTASELGGLARARGPRVRDSGERTRLRLNLFSVEAAGSAAPAAAHSDVLDRLTGTPKSH